MTHNTPTSEEITEDIIKGFKQILWWMAWADYQEEMRTSGFEGANLSGARIEEVADEPDEEQANILETHGRNYLRKLEEANKNTLAGLYELARVANGGTCESPERFGECLGYESVGAGVGWTDHNHDFPHEVPYHEFSWCDLPWPPTPVEALQEWTRRKKELDEDAEEHGWEWIQAAARNFVAIQHDVRTLHVDSTAKYVSLVVLFKEDRPLRKYKAGRGQDVPAGFEKVKAHAEELHQLFSALPRREFTFYAHRDGLTVVKRVT